MLKSPRGGQIDELRRALKLTRIRGRQGSANRPAQHLEDDGAGFLTWVVLRRECGGEIRYELTQPRTSIQKRDHKPYDLLLGGRGSHQ